jgi:hypothetical protein
MRALASDESRKLLDAMGVPVVVLRHRKTDQYTAVDTSAVAVATLDPAAKSARATRPISALSELLDAPTASTDLVVPPEMPLDEATEAAGAKADTVLSTTPVNPVKFTLVSAITADAMLLVELPEWASGLMDGRMTAVCSDILRAVSDSSQDADWQYFHWPIDGVPDTSLSAATEAVDAWLHRRWAEMQAPIPRVLTSVQSLDPQVLTADALLFPSVTDVVSDPMTKRALWEHLKTDQYANA